MLTLATDADTEDANQNAVAFSDDGSRLVTGGTDSVVRLWRVTRTVATGGAVQCMGPSVLPCPALFCLLLSQHHATAMLQYGAPTHSRDCHTPSETLRCAARTRVSVRIPRVTSIACRFISVRLVLVLFLACLSGRKDASAAVAAPAVSTDGGGAGGPTISQSSVGRLGAGGAVSVSLMNSFRGHTSAISELAWSDQGLAVRAYRASLAIVNVWASRQAT